PPTTAYWMPGPERMFAPTEAETHQVPPSAGGGCGAGGGSGAGVPGSVVVRVVRLIHPARSASLTQPLLAVPVIFVPAAAPPITAYPVPGPERMLAPTDEETHHVPVSPGGAGETGTWWVSSS